MNKLLSPKSHKKQINDCYETFDPDWRNHLGQDLWMNSFKYHLEQTGGLRIDFKTVKHNTELFYEITKMELVDESLYTMWLLRWS